MKIDQARRGWLEPTDVINIRMPGSCLDDDPDMIYMIASFRVTSQ